MTHDNGERVNIRLLDRIPPSPGTSGVAQSVVLTSGGPYGIWVSDDDKLGICGSSR